MNTELIEALRALIASADGVVENWVEGDLASAVNYLESDANAAREVLAKVPTRKIEIVGTQWGSKYGMEFTGYATLDGVEVARVSKCERGCDSYVTQRLTELMEDAGHLPYARKNYSSGGRENLHTYCERNRIELSVDVREVARKKDML